jgi:peptide/nickel transport system permease protein
MERAGTLDVQLVGGVTRRSVRGPAGALLRFVRQKPLGAFGLAVIVLLILVAVFRHQLATHDPIKISRDILQRPSAEYYLGTDNLGRDQYSRLVYGAWISLYVGILAVAIGTALGTTVGLLSGFVGGRLDLWLQRLVDVLQAFPGLILLLLIVGAVGQSINNVIIALAVLGWTGTSRVVRGSTLAVKENAYVEAARVLGASHSRIMLMHILPNVVAPIIVLATASLGGVILAEASLSFLGLGVPPPNPSWGNMLSAESRLYFTSAPWLALAPGIAISVTVLAFNLLGDSLRDVLDPRLRGTR